jgi:hypothetical protein
VRWSGIIALVVLALATPARAAGRRLRPRFEPTDLELEETGTLEADLQAGIVRGGDASRIVIPDLELDIGLLRNLEIDLDGAYAIEGPQDGDGSLGFDHAAPDSLWAAAKIGLASVDRPDAGAGIGVQIGPKFPVAPGTHGLGAEVVALAGARAGRWHLALNLGAFIDPASDGGRPHGLEGGLDVDLDLDPRGTWSLTGELGGVRFWSPDLHQLVATAGVAWAATQNLELSATGLFGFLDGGDKAAILLGVSPKLSLC